MTTPRELAEGILDLPCHASLAKLSRFRRAQVLRFIERIHMPSPVLPPLYSLQREFQIAIAHLRTNLTTYSLLTFCRYMETDAEAPQPIFTVISQITFFLNGLDHHPWGAHMEAYRGLIEYVVGLYNGAQTARLTVTHRLNAWVRDRADDGDIGLLLGWDMEEDDSGSLTPTPTRKCSSMDSSLTATPGSNQRSKRT